MATFAGNKGYVKVAGATVAEMDNWSVTPGTKDVDTSAFGDDWETSQPVINNWTAKFGGRLDPTDTNGQMALWNAFVNKTPVALEFDIDSAGTHKFTGSAFITPSMKTAVNAMATADWTAKGTGALTLV